jgi:uncharacterized protein (DUF1697 family)
MMARYVALLRAVNVGGIATLRMKDLVRVCEKTGFEQPRTYIQSGNVVFVSKLTAARAKAALEKALAARLGKPIGVSIRTGAEVDSVLVRNPFKMAPPSRVVVLFLDEPPGKVDIVIPGEEEVKVSGREVFVHYPRGQGTSKLRLPFAKTGTGRNLNTVAKLAEIIRHH